jgi:hypothetical protein
MNKKEMLSLGIVLRKKELDRKSLGVPDYLNIALKWFERYEKTGDQFAIMNYHHYIRVAEEFGMCEIIDPITYEDES